MNQHSLHITLLKIIELSFLMKKKMVSFILHTNKRASEAKLNEKRVPFRIKFLLICVETKRI